MKKQTALRLIPTVNFHLWEPCNMRCGFCFATFQDVKKTVLPKGHMSKDECIQVVKLLGTTGVEKINFAGGEPMLCPWLDDLIKLAHELGMVTSIVTNGSKITEDWLISIANYLDWIGISIDSFEGDINLRTGRAIVGRKVITAEKYISLCQQIKENDIRLKVNTVVSKFNYALDFNSWIQKCLPERWKLFQVLPIVGQNDQKIDEFLISNEEFSQFVQHHQNGIGHLIPIVPESNELMTSSYLMLDPAGRFFDNIKGQYRYSPTILKVGIEKAISHIEFDKNRFIERGGNYDF